MTISEPDDVATVRRLALECHLEEVRSPAWIRPSSPLHPVVVVVVRNEIGRLPAFLVHHRRLGIENFVFLDNGSTDGTVELLLAQPDVRLFRTPDGFDWRRKHGWLMHVVRRIGLENWYLLLDADEHCVYAECETTTLPDLVGILEAAGRRRARGALIDMYPQGPIAPGSASDGPIHRDHVWFDGGPYPEHRNGSATSRTGGPRARVFSRIDPRFRPQLTKYPLLKFAADDVAYNPHLVWPPDEHPDDPCWIGLLHYKFDGDFLARVEDAIRRRQYWNESFEYAVYSEALGRDPCLDLYWHGSRRYASSADLLEAGLIAPLPRARPTGKSEEDLAAAIRRAAYRRRAELLDRPSIGGPRLERMAR